PGSLPGGFLIVPHPLVLDDIEDLRSYERGRQAYRQRIIDLKRRRRVAVGPLVTLVFENRETMRFQVQEMARAEKMVSDAQVQTELDVYNALLPTPEELSATMFIELTDDAALREWLPKLVGIERHLELRFPGGDVARARPEATHEEALTRPTMTASVHYLRFPVTAAQRSRLRAGPVAVAVTHDAYRHATELSGETRQELWGDLDP
ncbi:MAG: DUF3501 family protein, partial [Acidimicrobiales bacterium]